MKLTWPKTDFDSPIQESKKAFTETHAAKGIRFRQSEDGTVIYSAADESKVKEIQYGVLESSFAPSYHFEDERLQTMFVDRLKSQGINYGVQIRDGKKWVTWMQEDDAKVQPIREEMVGKAARK